MALQEVQLSTSGKYTCQITLDAPPFQFTSMSGNMTVISIPERFPVISGNKGHQNYRLGERVQLNCTCFDTHPPANLRWFINDRQVFFKFVSYSTLFMKYLQQDRYDSKYIIQFLRFRNHISYIIFPPNQWRMRDFFMQRLV